MRSTATLALTCLVCLLLPALATAAPPLADRVPADALVYVGWCGSEGMGPAYDASHLRAILDAGGAKQLIEQTLPQLVRRVSQENRGGAAQLQVALDVAGPMWKHPTAVYIGGANWATTPPTPKVAVLCDAGTDAPALQKRLAELLSKIPPDNGPTPVAKLYGSLVVVGFGDDAALDAAYAQPPAQSLAATPAFTAALSQAGANPAFVAYMDGEATVNQVDEAVQKGGDADGARQWPKARTALGLNGLRRAILTAGFDGKDWTEQAFVSTDGSGTGILTLFKAEPLDPAALAVVPKTADSFSATRFDIAGFVDHLREFAEGADPEHGADQFDQALKQLDQMAGLDVRTDVLAAVGDTWVSYTDKTVGGPGMLGTVIVNKLRDPAKFDASMTALARRASAMVARQMRKDKDTAKVEVQFREVPMADGVTIHYLAVPIVSPAWAVKDGFLYVGLYPQTVSAAIESADKKGPSIADRPEYVAVMRRLGDHPAASVSFDDLPATVPVNYTSVLAMSRLYLGFADLTGVHPPAMLVPPLAKLMADLEPAGSETWADAAGWHFKSISPFPGSGTFGNADLGSVGATGPLMASVLMPSLSRARETANRAASASNLHQIGLAILLYQQDNNQKFPDDLGILVNAEQISAVVFLSPGTDHSVPAEFAGMTAEEKAKWVDDNTDYVFLGKGQKNPDATFIIAYEKLTLHDGEGANVLFGDGHVEWLTADDAKQKIDQQTAKDNK